VAFAGSWQNSTLDVYDRGGRGARPANHWEDDMKRKTGLFAKPGRSGKPLAMAVFGCAAVVAGTGPAPGADLTFVSNRVQLRPPFRFQ
jgi:hypothetical protein